MKKFIKIVLIVLIIFGAYKGISKYIRYKNAWKIIIKEEFINIREEPTAYSNKLGEAKRNEIYVVTDMYYKDEKFVWYQVKLEDNKKAGWICSERNYPYVEEVNNPKKDEDREFVSDYAKPVVKYEEDIYRTKDINSITYDHLKITDDSEYKVTSVVYKETCPDYHQYWIKYTVKDKYDNTTEKYQAIAFEEEPSDDLVKDLSEVRSNICQGKK